MLLDMWNKTQKLTRAGLLCALGCTLLYITPLFPTLDLSITAMAGLLTMITMLHAGLRYSVCLYVATSILAFIITAEKSMTVIYIAFLGYYPIVKSLYERCSRNYMKWIFKIIHFNIVFYVLWFLSSYLITDNVSGIKTMVIIQFLLNVTFIIYDIGLTRLKLLYIYKFMGHNR